MFYALLYTPIVGSMMLVEAIMVISGGMFISRRGFYAVTKLFFIHQITNFYATSAPKTFLRILTIDSMHPIGHHVPWFKFQIYEFYFFKNIFTMDLESWTKISGVQLWKLFLNQMLRWEIIIKNGRDWIGLHACKHASGVSVFVRWNFQLMERFLCGNELILIDTTTKFYASTR